ncbi:MAG: hypothetical protein JO266_11150 [Acidobacteria bacterium]|nr:hypothetical protein [Acidobacteriota bacterium]
MALTGAMVLVLVGAPEPTAGQAPAGPLSAIQGVLSAINGLIQTGLSSIDSARTALYKLQQVTVWPQQLIKQTRTQIAAIIGKYRNLMTSMVRTDLKSATLAAPQAFESLVCDHHINNFSDLTAAYGDLYGLAPTTTEASSTQRTISDVDDALVLDSLKLLKASDLASDIENRSADSIENAAARAAPGSAAFLTAAAIVSGISSHALTQKMLAAELRQEAAGLAQRNTLRKENVNNTTELRGVLVNLLQHQ